MNSKKLTIKDSSLSFLLGFLLSQFGTVVAMAITLIVFKIFNLNTENFTLFFNTAIGYMIVSLSLYVIMLLVFFFFNKNKENHIFKKVETKKIFFYILISLLAYLSLYPIIVCADSLFVKLGVELNSMPYSLTTKNYFISLISLVIAPAICEELLFRGIIFSGLKSHGKAFAIILTSLMFSLFHMSISQTIYPLLMGLLLGVIMCKEENIYYCIVVHMTNNFMTLTMSYLKINLIFQHWTYILLAILLFVMFVAFITYFILKYNKTSERNKISRSDKTYLFSSLGIMIFFWIMVNLI